MRGRVLPLVFALIGCAQRAPLPSAPVSSPPSATSSPVHATDTRAGVATVPFLVYDNRLLVQVMLNSVGPFTMIFDTAGTNTITPTVQRQLGLVAQGLEVTGTVGAVPTVHMHSVGLGSADISDQKFSVMNLERIRRTFHFAHLDGILGLEFLQGRRLRVDFSEQKLWIIEPGATAPVLTGAHVPLDWREGRPVIPGTIDGQPGKVALVTGERDNLTLNRKFARRTKLVARFRHRARLTTDVSLNGAVPGKITSLHEIELGPLKSDDVLARLPLSRHGFYARTDLAASAGTGLLKAYDFEFDFAHHELILAPRADFHELSTFTPVR